MMRLTTGRHTLAVITVLLAATNARAALPTPAPAASYPPAVGTIAADHSDSLEEDGAQTDDHLFDAVDRLGAKAKESNEINLDKSMLGLAARKGGEKGELAQKLDYIVVRSYEFAHENEYNMDDLKPIFKKLDEGGWKHLVRTREQKEMTDICVRQDAEGVTKEMVIISAEPKELSLIHLKGNVNLSDMKNFGSLMKGATKGETSAAEPKLNHH